MPIESAGLAGWSVLAVRGWLRLLPFFAGVFVASVAAGLSRLALARVMRYELLLPAVAVASFTSWFMAARAFSSTLGGVVVDRRPWLVRFQPWAALAGVSLVVYIASGAGSGLLVLALGAVWGFLAGLTWPVVQMLTSSLAGSWSGTAMSVYFGLGALGSVAGQYLYGVLPVGDRDAVRLSAGFFAAAALLLAWGSLRAPVTLRGRRRRGGAGGLRGAFGGLSGVEVWILLSAFAAGFLGGSLRELLYIYLGEVYGLGRAELASTLALAGLLSIATSLAVGPLADRVGLVPVLRAVLLTGAVGSLLLAAAPLGWLAALLGLALAQVASRSSLPLTRNAAVFAEERRGSLIGLSNTLSNLGQMTAPILGGWIYDSLSGSLGPFTSKGLVYVLAALMLALAALAPVRGGQASGESSQHR
jgi:predicted MFS family arabinose efflux permease